MKTNGNGGDSAGVPVIFIVDDDEAVRLALTMLIESCGWKAQAFTSAAEFLAASARNGRSHCLLLDLDMPGMNGAELLERLAADGRWLPTIVVSGFADSPLAARARRAGVRAVLKKPFNDQLLIGHLREALGLSPA